MCRLIRSHPLRAIFLILLCVSSINVIYKLLINYSNHDVWENVNVSFNKPVIHNETQSIKSVIYNVNTTTIEVCKLDFKGLKPSISVDQNSISLDILEKESWAANIIDGKWIPQTCLPTEKVAIIIPYRNREKHLSIFLKHMHPFLQKQLISYGIFVIEQAPGTRFNRAALFNVGYQEALKEQLIHFDCFIFHDVDLLPTNENNLYKCGTNPMHMSVAIDKFNYKLPYNAIFGGAVAMNKEQFLKVNGFSNIFYGWGGEDDDMSSRISAAKYSIARYPDSVARYVMIRHSSDSGNPINDARWKLLKDSHIRYLKDGISTLVYSVESNKQKSKLYKFVSVQFPEKEILKQWKL